MTQSNHTQHGFTLVETLISVTLLLLVIVGPMSIASRGMQNAFYAGDQTTAVFLAQEAIEHVQSLRDNNALANVDDYQTDGNDDDGDVWEWHTTSGTWNTYCRGPEGCDVDFEGGTYRNCGTPGQCQLDKYTGNGSVDRIYAYDTSGSLDWVSSPYTRVIKVGDVIDTDSNGDPIAVPVTVTVSWEASLFGGSRTIVLQTYLYNLYSRFE